MQSWHCKWSHNCNFVNPTPPRSIQKKQRALSLRRILNLIEDVVLLASNFESSWSRKNPYGVKHPNNINTNPCSCWSMRYLQSFMLGWITLPRGTWWNIFQTKSSDSRAPSLGALDRGRSDAMGVQLCDVDTRKMQASCKLSIRSLLLNWFLTMIWYLALCAMWVTKFGTSGRALVTRKQPSSTYCSPSYSGGFCLLIRYTGPSMLAFRHPGLDPSCCKKYATWHGKLMSQSQLNRIQGTSSEFHTTNLE